MHPLKSHLVLIKSVFSDGTYKLGTGYFIGQNIVLSAYHVALYNNVLSTEIYIRLEEKPPTIQSEWIKVKEILWKSDQLDAVILYINDSLMLEPVKWYKKEIEKDCTWSSTAYPYASSKKNEGKNRHYTTCPLRGNILANSGKGQDNILQIHLTVEAPPTNPENWQGASGAPIFVGDTLVGILKSFPAEYPGNRLYATPVYELFKDNDFQSIIINNATKSAWPTDNNWALVLQSEKFKHNDVIYDNLVGALKEIQIENNTSNQCEVFSKQIEEILNNPDAFLLFIPWICKSPLMIIDATGFQPGVMLLMGIRATVRRGLTIIFTTDDILKEDFIDLPFNIKETKSIIVNVANDDENSVILKDILKKFIYDGQNQIRSNPRYLDLPAYDAIRNFSLDTSIISKKTLVLCPFDKKKYRFNIVKKYLAPHVNTKDILRMVDIESPQLVGQSLYEHIRWTRKCIIDWTNWRPNVFYEMGVRLASNIFPPLFLINNSSLNFEDNLEQRKMLIKLFNPIKYAQDILVIPEIKNYFNDITTLRDTEQELSNDSIFNEIEKHFDWQQDSVDILPHNIIKKRIERSFGKDTSKEGSWNILYSSKNKDFIKALESQRIELLLAAWYYILNRSDEGFFTPPLNMEKDLMSLGNLLLEAIDSKDGFDSLKDQIHNKIKEIKGHGTNRTNY